MVIFLLKPEGSVDGLCGGRMLGVATKSALLVGKELGNWGLEGEFV